MSNTMDRWMCQKNCLHALQYMLKKDALNMAAVP